jgi:AraC family ethanolamine operon transcriptional activator
MNPGILIPELTPTTFRFTDIDEFRSSVRNLEVDFTPLVRRISAEQTILNLAGCSINLTRSFPRIIDGRFAPNCTVIGFTMDDGIPIRFNGVEKDQLVVVIGTHGATFSLVELVERQYASIVFTPAVEDRGWPKASESFRMFETTPAAYFRLREVVRQALSRAAQLAIDIEAIEASSAIRESMLAAVDAVFAAIIPTRLASSAHAGAQFKLFREIDAVLSSNMSDPIYSEALARQVGVSVRSVHDAIQRFRGMSLHRYLRVRRLWLARKRLLAGADSVKACALAFGFWHLGDFSASYRAQFGESPSETLVRSRKSS